MTLQLRSAYPTLAVLILGLPLTLGCPSRTATSQTVREATENIAKRPYAPWTSSVGDDLRAGTPGALEAIQCSLFARQLEYASAAFQLVHGRSPHKLSEVAPLVPFVPGHDGQALPLIDLIASESELSGLDTVGVRFAHDRIEVLRRVSQSESGRPLVETAFSASDRAASLGHGWRSQRPTSVEDPRVVAFVARASFEWVIQYFTLVEGRMPESLDELLPRFGLQLNSTYLPKAEGFSNTKAGSPLDIRIGINPAENLSRWGTPQSAGGGAIQAADGWYYIYRRYNPNLKTQTGPTTFNERQLPAGTQFEDLCVLQWAGVASGAFETASTPL